MSFDTANAAALLCAMNAKTVLVVGDIMLDRFVDGNVTRISPEAPVPVLGQTRMRQMAGGAANVACNLAQLGLQVRLVGVCGDDMAGTDLITELAAYPAIQFTPIIATGRPTSLKTRFRAGGQQILRVDDEVVGDITEAQADAFFTQATAALDDVDLVVISDYAKGALPISLLKRLITAAKAKHKMLLADPKLADFSAYEGVDILTPNLAELQLASKGDTADDATIKAIGAAASGLAKAHDINGLLTTLSARGLLYSDNAGNQFHDPASACEIFDVSGAGDTVVAAISGALAAGATIEDTVQLANHAAGVAVGKSGTATVVAGEILAHMAPATPATDWQSIAGLCSSWREGGAKIAFANGCFDLLHPGHIRLLQEAASHADRLVVGLNSDASVRRLKGSSRPIQSGDVRSAILAALPFVSAVVVFEEDTPFELISLLQPDVIVKGGDYTIDQIVGADIVAARGGRTIIIPTVAGHSTSRLITA